MSRSYQWERKKEGRLRDRLCEQLDIPNIVRLRSENASAKNDKRRLSHKPKSQRIPNDLEDEERVRALWATEIFDVSSLCFPQKGKPSYTDHLSSYSAQFTLNDLPSIGFGLPRSFDLYAVSVGSDLPQTFKRLALREFGDKTPAKAMDELELALTTTELIPIDVDWKSSAVSIYELDPSGALSFDANKVLWGIIHNA